MDPTSPPAGAPREPRPVPIVWVVLQGVLVTVASAVVLGALKLGLLPSVIIGGGSLLAANVLEAMASTTYTGPGRRIVSTGPDMVVLTLMVGLLLAMLLLDGVPASLRLLGAVAIGVACAFISWRGHRRALVRARAQWQGHLEAITKA